MSKTDDDPEYYENRTYYQAVCTHDDHGDDRGRPFEQFTPRLKPEVAELDQRCHYHDDDEIQIITYDCVGGIVPKPGEKPNVADLLEGGDE